MDNIDRLIAIEEIRQLKSRYFRYLDTKDWDGMATIFAPDAMFDARASHSVDGAGEKGLAAESNDWVYNGCDVIVDFIRSVATPIITAHHGHCHEIELLDESHAKGIIAMEDVLWTEVGKSDTLLTHGYGHYHEEYQRIDGRWHIQSSRITRLNVILNE